MKKLNPHQYLKRVGQPPTDRWCCQYCGAEGAYAALLKIACSHVYEPCKHCGQTPYCAEDCAGIMAALSDPSVHVVAANKDRAALAARTKKFRAKFNASQKAFLRNLKGRN